MVDINKLITRHSAVVGTTGSGKSTTVASIMNALSDTVKYPSSRILILDIHGEYGSALKDMADVYKVNPDRSSGSHEKELHIPFWALNSEELCELSFGRFEQEKEKNILLERIHKAKVDCLHRYPRNGANIESLSVDSPVPFSLHHLWSELFIETFGTYYKKAGNVPSDNLAYEIDGDGNELKGKPEDGVPPVFKSVKNDSGDGEKIHYLPNAPNLGRQLTLLGSKLRIPRYNFIFKPGRWAPGHDGRVESDLGALLENWIGSEKPITILDLSGVPVDILHTIIGALLRILYEALFWARSLSQGGRNRPLLLVMEEAHLYLSNEINNMASNVVQRIVKEGRKYGIGAMIVSQRPSEINSTILSQCGTFFALRLANSTDRGHIASALSDNLDGLTNMLPTLRTGEAIILGEAVKLPMRTVITPPPKNRRPDSQDPVVYDEVGLDETQMPGGWGVSMEQNKNYEELAEAWRAQNPKIKRVK